MAERFASGVIQWFSERVLAVTSGSTTSGALVESKYRFTVEQEPDSALDGLFFVAMTGQRPHGPGTGAPETRHEGDVVVRVAYFRGGGDAVSTTPAGSAILAAGDRNSQNRNANDDMQVLGDMIPQPASYDGANTGIRVVTYQGATKVGEGKARDIWEARFAVEWQSDLITA